MPSCPVCSVLRKKKGVFARSPCKILESLDLFMCLASFFENPLDTLGSWDQIHPKHIFRSNPEFYPFHEHCLLCLGFLFSYSLKSLVNREQVLSILFCS
jgi:hypothetical protein